MQLYNYIIKKLVTKVMKFWNYKNTKLLNDEITKLSNCKFVFVFFIILYFTIFNFTILYFQNYKTIKW